MGRFEVNQMYTCPGQFGGSITMVVMERSEGYITYCYEGNGRKYRRLLVIINNVEHVLAWEHRMFKGYWVARVSPEDKKIM